MAVFVLVMAPWWARQLAVFGSLSPSTASGKVLFIRDIGEWNSITTPASLEHLLGMGIGPLIATRIGGRDRRGDDLPDARRAASSSVPPMVIGAWARRRSTDFGPFFVYAAILFAFSALVSAVHVPGGTFIHSAVALAPHSYILALEGIVDRHRLGRGPPPGLGSATSRPACSAAPRSRFAVVAAVFGVARRSTRPGRPGATDAIAGRRRRSTRPARRRATG